MRDFQILLFPDFETLDALGPAEIIGCLDGDFRLGCYSAAGGIITSKQGVGVATRPLTELAAGGVLLLPGGLGTRAMVQDRAFLAELQRLGAAAEFMLTVCTGSALLAHTDLLDGRRATSNKQAFAWASSQNAAVDWQKSARWVKDGKFYTSSGVSAGLDMTLAFVADLLGRAQAEQLATYLEYGWHDDPREDPFAQ